MTENTQVLIPLSSKRIVLCGSMTTFDEMKDTAWSLAQRGVLTELPPPDPEIPKQHEDAYKRLASFAHIRRIRSTETYAILVVNPKRYGLVDYIGPSTFAEIAIAFAQRKPIYLLYGPPAVFEAELAAWNASSLYGNLDVLANHYAEECADVERQLRLF